MLNFAVYYQKFELNSCVFSPDDLILNVGDSQYIEDLSLKQLQDLGLQIETTDRELITDYALTFLFRTFNTEHDKLSVPKIRYNRAGHTSMSVGDYVVVTEEDSHSLDTTAEKIYICASAGWKCIEMSLSDFVVKKDKVIERVSNMPADILIAMASQVYSTEDEDGTFKNILDKFVYVENWESNNGK